MQVTLYSREESGDLRFSYRASTANDLCHRREGYSALRSCVFVNKGVDRLRPSEEILAFIHKKLEQKTAESRKNRSVLTTKEAHDMLKMQ